MNRRLPPIALLVCLSLWVAACYGVRYGFMEDVRWVGVCSSPQVSWECQLRATLGLMIHLRVLGWVALGLAVVATLVPRRAGWWPSTTPPTPRCAGATNTPAWCCASCKAAACRRTPASWKA